MENIKKNPLSLQLNAEDFLPASNEEKQSLVVMRESVNFWKDGIRRLKKNKIAMVSFVFIIAIAIFAYLLPAVWPYSYSEQVKGSNNLAPFEYSAAEQARIVELERQVARLEAEAARKDEVIADRDAALEVLGKGVAFLEAISSRNAR